MHFLNVQLFLALLFAYSPVKADFIKAKHQHLAFILRPSKEECCTEEELNRQLHSSVRTSNLETSLRLLAQGANPNYFYKVYLIIIYIHSSIIHTDVLHIIVVSWGDTFIKLYMFVYV